MTLEASQANDWIFRLREAACRFHTGETIGYHGTLSVKPGRLTLLTGGSGVGKTTLLNMVGLLNRASPMAGAETSSFEFRPGACFPEAEGRVHDLLAMSRRGFQRLRAQYNRKYFGFLPQEGRLLANLSLIENLELIGRLREIPPDRLSQEIWKVMKRVRLDRELQKPGGKGLSKRWQKTAAQPPGRDSDLADQVRLRRNPRFLSGGQQRRLAVARAILGDPQVILVDEPLVFLDNDLLELTVRIFLDHLNEGKRAVVIVSHQYERILQLLSPQERERMVHYHLEPMPAAREDCVDVQIARR